MLECPRQTHHSNKGDILSSDLLNLSWVLLMSVLGLAMPIGVGALAARGHTQAATVPGRLLLAGLLALLVSLGCGFSLQYGASHIPQFGETPHPGWQWAPLGDDSSLLSWAGPGVPPEDPPRLALFFLQALGAAVVVVLALAPLSQRLPGPGLAAVALLIGGGMYPLLGHWVWGNGWLARTGHTAYLGHGLIDFAGAGVYYALGGLLALAGLLATSARREHHPQTALGPALLALLGMTALHMAAAKEISPRLALVVANTWLSAAAGAAVAALYMAFTTTRLRSSMLGRGLLAGAAASAGIAPFAPPLTLLLVGAGAGLLACLGSYLLEWVWKLDDPAGIVSSFGLGGLWGLLALGLFANGSFGQGLNGIGATRYLGVAGQGLTGIVLLAPGMVPDYGQLAAQALGMVVLLLWALGPGWLVFRLASIHPARQEPDGETD